MRWALWISGTIFLAAGVGVSAASLASGADGAWVAVVLFGGFGVVASLWLFSTARCRAVVDEHGLDVRNRFRRLEIPWSEIRTFDVSTAASMPLSDAYVVVVTRHGERRPIVASQRYDRQSIHSRFSGMGGLGGARAQDLATKLRLLRPPPESDHSTGPRHPPRHPPTTVTGTMELV